MERDDPDHFTDIHTIEIGMGMTDVEHTNLKPAKPTKNSHTLGLGSESIKEVPKEPYKIPVLSL